MSSHEAGTTIQQDDNVNTAPLGSAAWINAREYNVGDELHDRATSFVSTIKWDILELHAAKLRHGISCRVGENYSVGHFNMVRQLIFEDGLSWVARLRLPELRSVFGDREMLDVERSMKVEIATMALLKSQTSIPVPEVFHSDVSANNEIGAPYILMSYINGNTASELRVTKNCEVGKFGDSKQDLKFRKQMAWIQIELSSLKFDKIGAIYQDGGSFVIGPEIETGQGPWDTETEYYSAIARHTFQLANSEAPPEVKTEKSFELPLKFENLMALCKKRPNEHQFRLTNRDFGAHNLLVDNEFNIIGLIDFDGVMAAPLELVAQFPQLTGLDRPIPGYVETRPLAIERIKRVEPQLQEYRDLVALAEVELNLVDGNETGIAEIMMSDTASIIQGLASYNSHQGAVNDRWMTAYEFLFNKYKNYNK